MELEKEASIFTEEVSLEMAGHGRRFINYIVDLLSFYAVLIVAAVPVLLVYPHMLDFADSPGGQYVDKLLTMLVYGLYMGLVEALFKGRSLGKMITGTRVVYEDGTTISGRTAFLRGLSRAVPFCAFSAFGAWCHPWHDRWTDTYVVNIKKSILPLEE
jgi:uncharacterized RDD family membrane protein YckC